MTMLGFHSLEVMHNASPDSVSGKFFLVYTKPSKVYTSMLKLYPYVEFVSIKKFYGLYACWLLLRYGLERNIFMFTPAFGKPPLVIRIFARLLTVCKEGSESIGFSERPDTYDRMLYTTCNVVDMEKNIFNTVSDSLPRNRTSVLEPMLLFEYDVLFRNALPKKYIVVHPFAANEGRTYPNQLTIRLLKYLRKHYPSYDVVITGSPENAPRAKMLIQAVDEGITCVSFYNPQYDFHKTMHIVACASLYIGVDTGITHLAAHLRVPTVVLGNNASPQWLPRYSSTTTILTSKATCLCNGNKTGMCFIDIDGCRYYRCMVDIPWQEIVSILKLHLHE